MMVKKQGIRHAVLILSILSVLAIFLVSAGLLYHSLYEYRKGEKGYGEFRQYTAKASRQELDPQSPDSPPAGGQKPTLAIDFEAPKKLNPYIIAWIHILGAPVSYPVTRGEDSSYYLARIFPGAYNGVGCIFMDCRSSLSLEGRNMVLYGHNMKNGSMFGSLKHYWGNKYYREHAPFYLYMVEGDNFLYHVTDRCRILAQTDFSSNMRDKEEETGGSGRADEGGRADRGAGITLATCVAGENKERLTIEVDTKRIE